MDMHDIRVDRLHQHMAKKVDLRALGPGAHMQWLSGFQPYTDEWLCLLCLSQDGAT